MMHTTAFDFDVVVGLDADRGRRWDWRGSCE